MLQSTLGSAQRFKKRERTQNWAYEEKHFLLELCRKDMHIIENKRLDSALTSLKNRAWKIIHQQFAIAFGTDRNCNRLKEQWRRMKACTRAEMLDYQQRIQRYGQEVADRKKPSQFTFEIWEFMQEAKKVCKNELMDDVDYSKMKLSLEENLPQGVSIKECSDENDDESSSMWDKNSTNLCEVQIKEDSSLNIDGDDDGDEYDKCRPAKFARLGALPSSSPYSAESAATKFNELLASSFASRINELSNNNNNVAAGKGGLGDLESYSRSFGGGGGDPNVSDVPVNMSQTDLSSTLEALNILKSRFHRLNELGQWKNAFHEVQNLSTNSHHSENHRQSPQHQQQSQTQHHHHHHARELPHHGRELQTASSPIPATVSAATTTNSSTSSATNGNAAKLAAAAEQQHQQSEHEVRMEILKTDLETAKINKETAEINRQIALQKLNSLNS